MRFKDFKFLLEKTFDSATDDELEGIKNVIASKIKDLPSNDATAKALKEIEELLQHVNAGGRMGMIYDKLDQINDPTVLSAQKMLARYILSMDATPEERKEFFSAWKKDQIVNVDALLSKKKVSFAEIFNLYTSNKMVKEFVDEMMDISALGQGKGEFGLNVLSKSIWDPEDGKGDLKIKLGKKVLQVECKTTDGGAARFSDQEVRPAEGYEAAAVELNKLVRSSPTYPMKVPEYGVNLSAAIDFYQNVSGAEKTKFFNAVKKVVSLIFPSERTLENREQILKSIKMGDKGGTAQAWANASFNYYMSKKNDDGVLYTDLKGKSCVFYTEANDLVKQGLRFHASTAYLSTVKDPGRGVYPQLEIKARTFGAAAATKSFSGVAKNSKSASQEYFNNLFVWAQTLANKRGITDNTLINKIANQTHLLIKEKVKSSEIILKLENIFPELKVAPAPTYQPVTQQQPQV